MRSMMQCPGNILIVNDKAAIRKVSSMSRYWSPIEYGVNLHDGTETANDAEEKAKWKP